MRRYAFLIPVLLLFTACKTASTVKPDEAPPDWVSKSSREKGMVCAVGASEPTFYKEDAKAYAAENARKELARTLNLNVNSIMVDTASERKGRTEASVTEVSALATSAVLERSEIKEYWYDEAGVASFKRKGITYALACMPAGPLTK